MLNFVLTEDLYRQAWIQLPIWNMRTGRDRRICRITTRPYRYVSVPVCRHYIQCWADRR